MAKTYKLDSNGRPFEFPVYYLTPKEYGKIVSEINTNYSKYEGKNIAVHYSHDPRYNSFKYFFENHGYNDYNVYAKQYIY